MKETGVLTEIKGRSAVVTVQKKEECKACGLCLFKENGKAEIYADNPVNAQKGDTVTVETKESGKLLGAVLVFLVPLIFIGIAVLLNAVLIKNDIFIPIISVGLIAIYYAILAILDKKFKKSKAFYSLITEIVSKGDDNAEISKEKEK